MKICDISQDRLAQLHRGERETATLTEGLAINLCTLLSNCIPRLSAKSLQLMENNGAQGITKRVALAGSILLEELGPEYLYELIHHPADTMRGIACYMIAAQPRVDLSMLLEQIKPLADDRHFGVREWAWLALRPIIAGNIELSISLLTPWCYENSPYLRRFASESTRPRGVWCSHISTLKINPGIALPILNPLKSDADRYVQNSVGNWLNDAAKTRADWVLELIAEWRADKQRAVSERILKLALRTINKTSS